MGNQVPGQSDKRESLIMQAEEVEVKVGRVGRYLMASVIGMAISAVAVVTVFNNFDLPYTKMRVVPDKYPYIQVAVAKSRPGDTVFVKAGVYDERVTLKDGVNLMGEGIDKTVICYTQWKRHVILVENCRSGTISDLTIEHRGHRFEKPLVNNICIANSFIEVVRCRIRKAASSGVYVTHGGHSVIRDCIIELNPSSGIIVDGGNTRLTLKNNTISRNEKSGIFFEDGSWGQVQNNTFEKNMMNGIAVCGKGTRVVATGNTCSYNGNWGIICWDGGKVDIGADNVTTGNGRSGIEIRN